MAYLYLLIIVFFLLYSRHYIKNKYFDFLPYLIMGIFVGLRYQVGRDYLNYCYIYNNIRDNIEYDVEFGYKIIVKICQSFGGTQQIVFLIFSLLTSFFTYKFIKKNSLDYNLSTIIYLCIGPYFLSSTNVIRQALSVSVFLYSIKFIKEKKLLKYLISILFSFPIHSTAIFLIPFYFILDKKIKCSYYLLMFLFLYFSLRTNLVNSIAYIFGYQKYIEGLKQTMDSSYLIFCLISVIEILLFIKYKKGDTLFINMNYISVVLITLGFVSPILNTAFSRMNSYFSPCLIILAPYILECFKQKKVVKNIIIGFCVIYYVLLTLTSMDLNPYMMNLHVLN